jgi:hypothetical protein
MVKRLSGLFCVIGAAAVILSLLPLRTAFQFEDDEGFEVIKPFMVNQGYALYKDVWNDQPPVYTVVLSGAFKAFGPSIFSARCVAAAFGIIFLGVYYELVRRRSGQWTGLAATFLLLAAPSTLILCSSVMLEVPAMGMALASVLCVFAWRQRKWWFWLAASGAVMGCALQIKMTAALVIPAIIVELALECMATRSKRWLPALVSKAAIWGTSVLALAMLIGLTWGRGSLGTSWKSHTSVEAVAGMDLPKDHVFNAGFIKDHIECVIAGLAGIVLGCKWGKVRELAFPVTMLFTVCAVHAVHRPWWNYYYVHIAIPLAWLAGWMVVELARRAMARQQNGQFNLRMRPTWVMMGLCLLAALPLARSERRLELVVKDLRHCEPASTNGILDKMKIYAGQTKWVYAADGMYPFQARLPVPPELAIVMPKRFWSGQITTTEIIDTCRRYQPEMIILPKPGGDAEWQPFLKAGYFAAGEDAKNVLYVANRLDFHLIRSQMPQGTGEHM